MAIRSLPIRMLFPLIAFSIFLAATVTVGGAAVAAHQASDARIAVSNLADAQKGVSDISFLNQRIQTNNTVRSYVPEAASTEQVSIAADLASIVKLAAHLRALPLTSSQQTTVSAVNKSFQQFATWLTTIKPTTSAAATAKLGVTYQAYVARDDAATANAQKALAAGLADQQTRLASAVKFSLWLVIGLCSLSGLLVAALILLIGRSINARLAKLRQALQALADGNLTLRVPAGGQQELAEIAGNVNSVAERFASALSAFGDTSNRLAGAATHLETLAADVGRSSGETSAQAAVVARTADEVSQNVQSVAAGGDEMGASIAEIARNAHEAARVATGAVQAVVETTGTMSKLGDSSREIGDVVRLITSIAEQTNLLALNATIEAARAGDAGKGFAVVADEVKQLAQETARATEDISRRVETIQEDADQAARAISDIAGVISRINEFQTTIASAVEEQTATTQSINAGVSVAATGSGQIARSISGVADAAEAASASIGAAHDSARDLSRMSDELGRLVSGFRF
jgi:methyl-accepting chemotaxis protein